MTSSHSDRNGKAHVAAESSNHAKRHLNAGQDALTAGEVIVGGRRFRLIPVDEICLSQHPPAASLLTGRELQIVSLVAEGRVNKQIAGDLHISEWTVSTHLRRIFCKLGVDTRAAMVSKCSPMLLKRPSDQRCFAAKKSVSRIAATPPPNSRGD
jgi:DNA-binding NarL/FixJ family response regulator